mmetsp:Transcript_7938/g.13325  ORF Transcript_7938/g.13325 Transcript_7938/m.13325 type:complete len:286 (+) Transcript_7938:389-1246(+)
MLRGGRNCTDATQCVNMRCQASGTSEVKKCVGRQEKESCSSHEDCDAGLFCDRSLEFPFKSSCKSFRTSYEQCTETEECQHNFYCWYADINDSPIFGEDSQKKCLPLYSQPLGTRFGWDQVDMSKSPTFEDFEHNGKNCKSGLAFFNSSFNGSQCTENLRMMQGDNLLSPDNNYLCNASDNENPCRIYYTEFNQSFEVPCKCSLEGGSKGYCASIIGTQQYALALAVIKQMLEKSSCHTLDRHSYEAQLDCNEEPSVLQLATERKFQIDHWELMHNSILTEGPGG